MHYYLSHSRVPVENVLLCFSRSVLIERRATEFKLCPPPPYFLSINFSLRRCVDSCYRSCLLRSDGQTFDCSVSSVSYGLYPPALAWNGKGTARESYLMPNSTFKGHSAPAIYTLCIGTALFKKFHSPEAHQCHPPFGTCGAKRSADFPFRYM
jgi:hypothetical protein